MHPPGWPDDAAEVERAGELPDRPARGARGGARRRHPRRLPRQDRPPRRGAPHLDRRRRGHRRVDRLRGAPHLRAAGPLVRGAGGDRRDPVARRRRLRDLDDLLDVPPGSSPEGRARGPGRRRRGQRGQPHRRRPPRRRSRGARDRAVPLGRHQGDRRDLGAAPRSVAGPGGVRRARRARLPGRAAPRPAEVLHLDRRVPRGRGRRRRVLRHPRPPGGRHPARARQPGLRRVRRGPARLLVRHDPEGHRELHAQHDLAAARVLVRLPGPGHDAVRPRRASPVRTELGRHGGRGGSRRPGAGRPVTGGPEPPVGPAHPAAPVRPAAPQSVQQQGTIA